MKNYLPILKMYASKELPWYAFLCLKDVFKHGDYAFGTDRFSMARVPLEVLDIPAENIPECVKALGIYENMKPEEGEIPVSELRNLLHEWPKKEITETRKIKHKCKLCDDSGMEEWKHKMYSKRDKCPQCKGRGATCTEETVKTGIFKPDEKQLLMIDEIYGLRYFQVELLVKTADALDLDTFTLMGRHTNTIFFRADEVLETAFAGQSTDISIDEYVAWKNINELVQ